MRVKEWIKEKDEKYQISNEVKSAGKKVFDFCHENKEDLIKIAPIVGAFAITAIHFKVSILKESRETKRIRNEQDLKELYIYDRSAGHYYYLRRKPTNSEYAQIDRRRAMGEPYYVILTDMRLL